ncbi:MAG: glyoxalase [Burkholderiaceae bacterium]|nr:glyoxalase [Burkholderiaceae bacterium]
MSTTLSHLSIRTLDLKATADFYNKTIDLVEGPRPPFQFPGIWLYAGDTSDYANAVLHLIGIDKNDPSGLKAYLGDRDLDSLKGSGAVDHVAFFVTGLEEKINRLNSLGIPFRERSVPLIKLHQLFVDDPNGVVIELNYPAAEKEALDAKAAAH